MKHLLNLYTEELRERPLAYGFNLLLGAMLSVAVLMLLLGIFTHQRLQALETERQAQLARQQQLTQSMAVLDAQQGNKGQLEALQQELAWMQQDIQGRERALIELKGYMQRPIEGFSPVLHGLAEASGHGVWLTHIHLVASATESMLADVRLGGKMRHAEQLPRYLDALAASEALRGQRFNSMQAQRPEPVANQTSPTEDVIAFMVSTRSADGLPQGGGQ